MSEPTKGTYALVLHLEGREEITVGKLGTFSFPTGYYLYLGSALGTGGLEARLARHRRRDKKLHWHIDYLLEHAQLVEVLSTASTARLECLWAQAARQLPGGETPVPGFGSSDCRCPSHLIRLASTPSYEEFTARLLMVNVRNS
jgi:Uri superfamily endonuclease